MEKKWNVTEEDIDRLLKTFGELNHCDPWSRVTRNDFTVRRFSFGFVNDISCCELTEEARKRLCQTNLDNAAVVVKYFPKDPFFEQNPIEMTAILTMIAENGLSPQNIYLSDECHIQQYIESSRTFTYEDDCDEEMVRESARILARFHSLKPPLSTANQQQCQLQFDDLGKLQLRDTLAKKHYLRHLENNPEYKKKYYETLSLFDVTEGFEFLRELIGKVDTPHVFIHHDFNRGNRLVTTEKGGNHKRIYLLDFDYSGYNHRGYDFGRYFSNYRHLDDMFGNEGFPTDQEMELFLGEYQRENSCIFRESYLADPANSMDQLRIESKLFILYAYFLDASFGLLMYGNSPEGEFAERFLNFSQIRYEGFLKLRKQFTEDGTLASFEKVSRVNDHFATIKLQQ